MKKPSSKKRRKLLRMPLKRKQKLSKPSPTVNLVMTSRVWSPKPSPTSNKLKLPWLKPELPLLNTKKNSKTDSNKSKTS